MEKFNQYFHLVSDPSQRLYWPLLIVSLIIIFLYTKKQGKDFKEIFFNESSLTDLKLLFLNKTLQIFIFPLILFSSFKVAVFFQGLLNQAFPFYSGLQASSIVQSVFATIVAFVINDFFRFVHHVFMHRVSFLKKLHGTHHSATSLTPLTLFRTHPIEAFIADIRNVLSMGVIITFMSFTFKGQVSVMDILGVNLFGFIFNAAFSNLRHSNVPLSFGILEYVFISPRMHQIHHSNKPEHFEKNYGVALAIWDQLLGSFFRPSQEDLKNIQYGYKFKVKESTSASAASSSQVVLS